MVNKKRNKRVAIVLVCILIPVIGFGFGYFFKKVETEKKVSNTLTVDGDIGGTIAESTVTNENGIVPGDTVNETIKLKPNSTADSLIRVKVESSWTGGENVADLKSSNIELIYDDSVNVKEEISNESNYWYKSSDGYLYYMSPVKKSNEDMPLVKGIKFIGSDEEDINKYQGRELKIRVNMDMVQCKYGAFEQTWGIDKESSLGKELTNICNTIE